MTKSNLNFLEYPCVCMRYLNPRTLFITTVKLLLVFSYLSSLACTVCTGTNEAGTPIVVEADSVLESYARVADPTVATDSGVWSTVAILEFLVKSSTSSIEQANFANVDGAHPARANFSTVSTISAEVNWNLRLS